MRTTHYLALAVVATIGIAFILASCASEQASDPGRYYNGDMGFSIKFHSGWEVVEGDGIELALVEAISPWEDDSDEYAEHISVDVEDLGWQPDLETYFAEMVDEQGDYLDGFRPGEKGSTEIDGVDARWIVFDFSSEGYPMRAVGYTFLNDRKAFLIAGVAQADKFVLYQHVFEQTAESFRFE
jgi:hypothetical protein